MLRKIVLLTAVALGAFAGVAFADAGIPTAGSTTLVSESTSGGAVTITVQGQWSWTSDSQCAQNRDGVGYQVDWNDGNTANPIGTSGGPPPPPGQTALPVIYVGDSVDNMVHSLNNLDANNTNLAYAGLPASYLTHNTTSATPTKTDATNWNSNCGSGDSGTWGPISHTYPVNFAGPIEMCPVIYDPHGKSQNEGGSSAGDLTAGGTGHNNDNSYEGNGSNDACNLVAFPMLSSTATATAHETQSISDSVTLSGSNSAQGTISWSLLKYPSGTTAAQIAADQCKSGTQITGQTFATTVNGNGTYASPGYTVPTGGAGVYQWVATYNSTNSNNASSLPEGCGVAGQESVVTALASPGLTLAKQQAWDTGGSVPNTAVPAPGTFTSATITGAPGWIVDYEMTVTNTGNETLGINFADPAAGAADAGCDAGTLSVPDLISGTYTAGSPGNGYGGLPTLTAGGQIVYTCKHTVKSSDNPWSNTASLSGIDINGTAVSAPNVTVDVGASNPTVTLTKMQTIAGSGAPFTHSNIAGAKGQTVDYQITATNPNASDSLALSLSDPACDPNTLTAPTGTGLSGTTTFSGSGNTVAAGNTLAAGGSAVYTCTHAITTNDTPFTNTATVTATDTTTQQPATATDSVRDTVQVPSITLTKGEQVNSTSGSYVHGPVSAYVGNTINYLITVTNTGANEVTPTLTDASGSGGTCDAGTLKNVSGLNSGKLAAGASATWTCSHLVTASDPTTISNTASATAVDDFGNSAAPASDTVTANVLTLTMTLTKEQRIGSNAFTTGSINANPDDVVDYEMIVTNTSDQPLTPTFSDPTFTSGSMTGGCDAGTLVAPNNLDNGKIDAGGSATWTCTHTFNETDPSPFVNTATVFGTDANGHTTPTQSASVSANLLLIPAMTTSKEQYDATTNPSGPYTTSTITGSVGDTIQYLILVNNTGNEDLTLSASDPGCTTALQGPTITPGEDADDLVGNTLEQGASAQYTCSRTLAAADAPSFTNVATVSGKPDVGSAITQTPSATVNVTTNPAFTIVKSQSVGGSAFTTSGLNGQVGQTVSYQIVVTNTGNTSLTFSSFTDSGCDGGTIAGGPSGALAVNGSATYTCSHVLTFTDQGHGSYSNQATVTGTPPANQGSAVTNMSNVVTVALPASEPAFTIVKTESLSSGGAFGAGPITATVGATVFYQVTVTNTGNVPLTFGTLTDANCDAGTLAGGPGGAVAAGNSATWTCSHAITAADQTAGSYSNVASVTGSPPAGDGSSPSHTSNTVVANVPTNAFTLVKGQSLNSGGPFNTTQISGATPGQVVYYQITATNTGNTTLAFTSFTDGNCDAGTIAGGTGAGSVAPAASAVWTCQHTLTFADQGAGSFANTASLTATPPSGDGSAFSQSSNQVVTTLTAANPAFTIAKAESLSSGGPFSAGPITTTVGATVFYQVTVTNTGNVPLTFGTLTDANCDSGTLAGGPGGAVAAGNSATWTCSHAITTADQTTGSYSNVASVTGSPPAGDGSSASHTSNTVVANVSTNAFTITKGQSLNSSGPFSSSQISGATPGQVVYYQITVTDTGNTTLTFTNFSDADCDAGTIAGGPAGGSLTSGSSASWTCQHTLTYADQGAGSYTNSATVTANPPAAEGNPFSQTSNPVITTLTPAFPQFTIVKSQSLASAGPYTSGPITATLGATVYYQIVVLNTGTVPLTFGTLVDAGCDAGTISGGPSNTVPVGSGGTYICSHVITASDQTQGAHANQAAVSASPPPNDGSPVMNDSNIVTADVPTNAFTITKGQSLNSNGPFSSSQISGASPGQVVYYQVTATNTGNTTLAFTNFTDANCDAGTIAGGTGAGSVAPTASAVWTCQHTLTFGDQGAGMYPNQATVTGNPPSGDGSPFSQTSNQVVTTLTASNPAFTIMKLQSLSSSGPFVSTSLSAGVGTTVFYQVIVTNTGNVPLTFTSLDDSGCDAGTTAGGPSGALAANGSATWTCSHTITTADQTAGTHSNAALAVANPPTGDGSQVSHTSNTVVVNVSNASFTLVKTESINGSNFVTGPIAGQVAQTVNYIITATNTGNTSLTFTSFTDAGCDSGTLAGGPGGSPVAAGSSTTWTCSHLLTFADQGAGGYSNQASVVGNPPSGQGSPISQSSNPVLATLPASTPAFTLAKAQSLSSSGPFASTALTAPVGTVVYYQITATNTGNVPLSISTPSDSGCDGGIIAGGAGASDVAPGSSAVWVCHHTISSADQTAGSYTNTASATGTPPSGDGSPVNQTSNGVVVDVPTNAFTLVKTQATALNGPYGTAPIGGLPVGTVVYYQMTATNTGNTALTFSGFTDNGCDAGTLKIPGTTGPVQPGSSNLWTCTHTITYADQGTGSYSNQASLTATPPSGDGNAFSQNSNQVLAGVMPASVSFTLTKAQGQLSLSGPFSSAPVTALVGTVVYYQITATNSGNVPLSISTPSDSGCDGGIIAGGAGASDVAPGSSAVWVCQHTISSADQAAGSYTNTASATGTPPSGDGSPVNQTSNSVVANVPNNTFTLVKTQATALNGPYGTGPIGNLPVGTVVYYQMTATNTGNTALTFSGFTDNGCDAGTLKIPGTTGPVQPGSSNLWTCTHTITYADQGSGTYSNQASLTATPPSGDGNAFSQNSNQVLAGVMAANASVTLAKTQSFTSTGSFASTPLTGSVGQTVYYQITATDTGNVPLTFAPLSDSGCDASTLAGGPGSGAVPAGSSTTWTCSHTLTAADRTAGSYSNTATATGSPPANDGNPVFTGSNTVVVNLPNSSFTFAKAQSLSASGPFTTTALAATAGQTVYYQLTATNTGNTALTFSNFVDAGCDAGTLAGGPGSNPVAAGVSTTWTCWHTLTLNDQAAGTYNNSAAVTGTPTGGVGNPSTESSNGVQVNLAAIPLSLTIQSNVDLGTFTPTVTQTYTGTAAATVSAPGPAFLTVADLSGVGIPGYLYNSTPPGYSLARPVQISASSTAPGATGSGPAAVSASQLRILTYTQAVLNDSPTITLSQLILGTDSLRTGVYDKTLTFTLQLGM